MERNEGSRSMPRPCFFQHPFSSTFHAMDGSTHHQIFVLSDSEEGDEDPAFLSAIAAAEADGLRGLSHETGVSKRKHDRQHDQQAVPSESVSSNFPHSYGDIETASKRSKAEPEGEYLAALRGTHSETWQAMNSKMRPDGKPRNAASGYSGSANLGFDGGAGGGAGGACFHCGKDGHWAKDCPARSATTSWGSDSGSIPGQAQMPEKNCPCGAGACKILTANTEKNPGRQFYKCPLGKEEGQCGFFEWCDSTGTSQGLTRDRGSSYMPSEFPCPCGAGPCSTLTAKTEKNMGRQFFKCPLNQGEGACGFFKWCDENLPASAAPGPAFGSNFGDRAAPVSNVAARQCYRCGMDGHWANDCSNSSAVSQNIAPKGFANTIRTGQAGSNNLVTCYKCNQVGHWANNCPNQQSSYGSRGAVSGGFNRYGSETTFSRDSPSAVGLNSPGTGRGVTSGKCYTCGGEGHWSPNCPNLGNKGIGAVSNAGFGSCLKCGSPGHWSKDCPNASNTRSSSYGGKFQGAYSVATGPGKIGSSTSCYKCGGEGHWANECREDGKGRGMY